MCSSVPRGSIAERVCWHLKGRSDGERGAAEAAPVFCEESPNILRRPHRGGGGNRTRVLQLLSRPSPSAAGLGISSPGSSPASAQGSSRHRFPCSAHRRHRSGESHEMTPADRSVGLGTGGRCCYLGSKCELRLGICVGFRLFNVAPETTARFSHLDDRSRSLSPPGRGHADSRTARRRADGLRCRPAR